MSGSRSLPRGGEVADGGDSRNAVRPVVDENLALDHIVGLDLHEGR